MSIFLCEIHSELVEYILIDCVKWILDRAFRHSFKIIGSKMCHTIGSVIIYAYGLSVYSIQNVQIVEDSVTP